MKPVNPPVPPSARPEDAPAPPAPAASGDAKPAEEIGGRRDGLDPTRYGDWEKAGRCIDF